MGVHVSPAMEQHHTQGKVPSAVQPLLCVPADTVHHTQPLQVQLKWIHKEKIVISC